MGTNTNKFNATGTMGSLVLDNHALSQPGLTQQQTDDPDY